MLEKLAIIIPCYNEASNIDAVIKDYHHVFPDASIYVYDNNSTDDTAKIAAKAGAIVRQEPTQGKGHVIRRALREINARCYLLTDGDTTYPAATASQLVTLVLDHQVDMAIGDRLSSTYFTENKRAFHGFGNHLVCRSINLLFHTDILDVMTGLRALSFEFAKTFPVLSDGFQIETEMSIHAADKKMVIQNIPIAYHDRPEGSTSKLHTFSDGTKVLLTIFRLYRNYHPMQFFGLLAFSLILLSIIFLIPILLTYWQTGLVPRYPTLIVCGFTVIAAIQSLFTGLILSHLLQKNHQDFEYHLITIAQHKKNLLERST